MRQTPAQTRAPLGGGGGVLTLMSHNAMSRQQLQRRHLKQSLVEEQLPGGGPLTGVHLQTLLDELLQYRKANK